MTDEEFLFRQTERERKRNGRGDYNKKRQGGRHVRLPSDNMSAKERKAMNGECRSYPLNSPVKWAEFRVWPDDIKREYINGLRARYGATTGQLCEMFGCAKPTMWKHLRSIGVEFENLCPNVENREMWAAFLRGEPDLPFTEEEAEEEAEAPAVERLELEDAKRAELANVQALLMLLKGTGARLTIELTL